MSKSKKLAAVFLLGIPALCCLGGGLFLFSAKASASTEVAKERVEDRKSGMPIEPAELATAPIPYAQNAAPIYQKAQALLDSKLKDAQGKVNKSLGTSAPLSDQSEGRKALSELAPVFELLSKVNTTTGCHFNRDWTLGQGLMFPEFAGMKGLTRDLVAKGLDEDRRGDWKAALSSMSLASRVARDAGSDPILISMLVEVACRAIVNSGYEQLIKAHPRDQAFLDSVEPYIKSEKPLPNPRQFLSGEIVLGRLGLRSLKSLRDFQYSTDDQPARPSKLETDFLQSRVVQDTIEAKFLAVWRLGWTQLPKDSQDWQGFGQAMSEMQVAVERDNSLSNSVNKVMFPIFSQAADAIGNLQAHNRLLLDSVTMLKIRLAKGKLPPVLPDSLGEDRLDPFDGNPLRYRRTSKGFILYSIGRDREDNDGHARNSKDSLGTKVDEVMQFN